MSLHWTPGLLCLGEAACLCACTVIEVKHTVVLCTQWVHNTTGLKYSCSPPLTSSYNNSLNQHSRLITSLLLSCAHLPISPSPHAPPPPPPSYRTWDGVAMQAWLCLPWRKRSASTIWPPSLRRSVAGEAETRVGLEGESFRWLNFIVLLIFTWGAAHFTRWWWFCGIAKEDAPFPWCICRFDGLVTPLITCPFLYKKSRRRGESIDDTACKKRCKTCTKLQKTGASVIYMHSLLDSWSFFWFITICTRIQGQSVLNYSNLWLWLPSPPKQWLLGAHSYCSILICPPYQTDRWFQRDMTAATLRWWCKSLHSSY